MKGPCGLQDHHSDGETPEALLKLLHACVRSGWQDGRVKGAGMTQWSGAIVRGDIGSSLGKLRR